MINPVLHTMLKLCDKVMHLARKIDDYMMGRK